VELARAQYASIQRLLTLPASTGVWPTHGAGSFCSAPAGAERVSTIGHEVATNPLLAAPGDENTFVTRLLAGLGTFPPYFHRLGELNRRGPAVLHGLPTLAGLDAAAVGSAVSAGARLIDVRPLAEYAAAHIGGSVSIPLRAQFATWLGWLTTPTEPLILVRDPDQDPQEVLGQALNIGHENLTAELAGGVGAWTRAGGATISTRLVHPGELTDTASVLDVRQRREYLDARLPGATHTELGDIAAHPALIPADSTAQPTVLMCGHGERAMSAASLLEAAGHQNLSVLVGGPQDWALSTGRDLATGTDTDTAGLP